MYNKTISWKRTISLVNILNNNKLALSNIDVAKNAYRQHRTNKLTYQRRIAFSISWTRQEPRGLVGSSVISDQAVPGSNSTAVSSVFLCHSFFSKWGQRKISLSLSRTYGAMACGRWPPGDGLRAMASGRWPPGDGLRAMASGRWPPGDGLRAMASGRWPPGDGLRAMASAHARHSEVTTGGYYKNYKPPRRLLSGFTNLWPKYVLNMIGAW